MPYDTEKTLLICPLTCTDIASLKQAIGDATAGGADAIEIRLDYLDAPWSQVDLVALLKTCPLELVLTFRPSRQGGRYQGSEDQRLAMLRELARLLPSAWVDVECDVPQDQWPVAASSSDAKRIILSHHDFTAKPANLMSLVAELDASPAGVNKVAFAAAGPEDALVALDVMRSCRKPTIAIAMGEAGVISRLLSRKVGAFGSFAALNAAGASAPGQPTLEQYRKLYRWDAITEKTAVYGVIGCPVGHSMSPAIHNAAFEAVGIDGVYVPLLIQPGADNFCRFMDAVLERPWLNWRGLSVTIPHKENALAYIHPENCDELSRTIGAINTITIGPDKKLRGDNTDYSAAIDALCQAMGIAREGLAGRAVVVLGAGGAARAIVAALAFYKARVTVLNRTIARAEELANEFGCGFGPLEDVAKFSPEIIVNCTPIGMHPKTDATPLKMIPPSVKVVFDTIYNPLQTLLLKQAQTQDCLTVSGLEMFANQAVAQFEIWTSAKAPRDIMRDVVVNRLRQA